MWNKDDLVASGFEFFISLLNSNRALLISYIINSITMLSLFIHTLMRSKSSYALSVSVTLFISFLFGIMAAVLANWVYLFPFYNGSKTEKCD